MQAVIEVDPLPPAPHWQADGVRAWTLGLGRARLIPGSYLARDPDDDADEQQRQPQKPEGADGGRYTVLGVSISEGDGIREGQR